MLPVSRARLTTPRFSIISAISPLPFSDARSARAGEKEGDKEDTADFHARRDEETWSGEVRAGQSGGAKDGWGSCSPADCAAAAAAAAQPACPGVYTARTQLFLAELRHCWDATLALVPKR